MNTRTLARATLAAAAGASLIVLASTAAAQGRPLGAELTGAAERPGPGDPDGTGTASFTVNPGLGQFCYEVTYANLFPLTGAHVHIAPTTTSGPVVIPLAIAPDDGLLSGCATIDRDLAVALIREPADYYVNLHTTNGFAPGAIRGQLSK